jgi:hypothetical protein
MSSTPCTSSGPRNRYRTVTQVLPLRHLVTVECYRRAGGATAKRGDGNQPVAHKGTERRQRWCDLLRFERRLCPESHHERLDGRGYPAGMGGRDIPLEARLISVVDAYDAMTSDRPYKKALGHLQAVEQLDAGAGSQFDPAVVEATKAVLCDDGWSHAAREQASGSPPPLVSAHGRRRKEEKPRKSRIRA